MEFIAVSRGEIYLINETYWFWFLYYGAMIGLILILHWRLQPTLDDWKRFTVEGLIFVIPYEIINALGINIFRLWQNNADSPLSTLFGSPIETIPFAFLGAILSLLFLKFFKSWRGKCIL